MASAPSATTTGWTIFVAALGMMMGLMAPEVAKLATWGAAFAPGFVAVIMLHFSIVVMAFVGGKMIPENRPPGMQTRATDAVQTTSEKV